MKNSQLEKAVEFHGHLGPYLVLGLLIGEAALKKIGCKKHFGLEACVRGALKRPQSCLIDGIQLSTGCTFGKGNIRKSAGKIIEVELRSFSPAKKLTARLTDALIIKLNHLNGHRESETFARKLFRQPEESMFNFRRRK